MRFRHSLRDWGDNLEHGSMEIRKASAPTSRETSKLRRDETSKSLILSKNVGLRCELDIMNRMANIS